MIYKFFRALPCSIVTHLIENMLSNNIFDVIIGNSMSGPKKVNKFLFQGSILAV